MATRALLLDKDGTLVHPGGAIEGAGHFVANLAAPYAVLSNTGTKDAATVAADLTRALGVPVAADRVVTAHDCMRRALDQSAFDRVLTLEDVADTPPVDAGSCCVAAFTDGDVVDFVSVASAVAGWLDAGAHLWITSDDSSLSLGGGRRRPGPGVFLHAVKAATTGDDPSIRVFGKAHDALMAEYAMKALRRQGFVGRPDGVCLVGDRFDTDVRAGRMHGWRTCLVETGCHTEARHLALYPTDGADAVASSVRDLGDGQCLARGIRTPPAVQSIALRLAEVLIDSSRRIDSLTGHHRPRRIHSCPDRLSESA